TVDKSPKVDINEGSDVTLTCTSHGNPPVSYTWLEHKGGKWFEKGAESKLTLEKVTRQDSGEFYCRASNDLGKVTSRPTIINVNYPPKVVIAEVNPEGDAQEGNDITLSCSSDGDPAATYTWIKKNFEEGSESTLYLKNVTSKDSGDYYCRAGNELGRKDSSKISINITYAPRNTVVLLDSITVKGDNVTLACKTDSNPPAEITWYKNGIQYTESADRTLQLYNISIQDSDNYSCVATNVLGNSASEDVSLN
uniref:Ig-like domain-containing protein n=1 Tax=Latimeria chalumnae TaxID=7897 RepID=H3A674_LATCH